MAPTCRANQRPQSRPLHYLCRLCLAVCAQKNTLASNRIREVKCFFFLQEAEEMVQWLRVLNTLAENLSMVSKIYIRQFSTIHN